MNSLNAMILATMRWLAVSMLACALAALSATSAKASTGLTVLPATGDDGPITVFYPSSSPHQALQRDGFTLNMAADGVAAPGNKRLIVLSHGTGSPPWVLSDLANHLAQAGFVVAIPEHRGDNRHDRSKVGPQSWKLRPVEISHAIDAISRDKRLGSLVDFDQVGMWGFSAGGHTALTLAGGQWSAARLRDHCNANIVEDFAACSGGIVLLDNDWMDGIKKSVALFIIRLQMGDADMHGHTDPRIKAIVSAAPWAANFDLQTLRAPAVPLGIVQVQQDAWLAPRFHSSSVLKACTRCEVIADLPDAGHGTMISPMPANLPSALHRLVSDPPRFNRTLAVADLHERTVQFFMKHLNVTP